MKVPAMQNGIFPRLPRMEIQDALDGPLQGARCKYQWVHMHILICESSETLRAWCAPGWTHEFAPFLNQLDAQDAVV